MPEIAPFAAIRYRSPGGRADLSDLLAPPYDVLDESDKSALLTRNPRNIVALDLPHLPPKSVGPPEAYERSARLLSEWLADGTLVRDAAPAFYLYHQSFTHEGRPVTRRMFTARARLTPFSQGDILPHERTFGGPKEDRLALMHATRCNLSPVFGLYGDANGKVDALLAPAADGPPDAAGTLDAVENRLWRITERTVIDRVVSALSDKKVYIADGHHRYETALRYREQVAQQLGGKLPQDHPANFVMLVLAAMDDPGCLILPYHRVLLGINLDSLLAAWSKGVALADSGRGDIELVDGLSGRRAAMRFTSRPRLALLEPTLPPAWHRLDTAYLHRFLVDECLRSVGHPAPRLEYVKSAKEAVRTARGQAGVALLLNATPMAHLRAVSEAGGLMPQKSTYFHPKLATGLTLNPLA